MKERKLMTYRGFLALSIILFIVFFGGQSYGYKWEQTFGSQQSNDFGNEVKQTTDGGFIIVCDTVPFGAQGSDVYLIKADGLGNELWSKTFGGAGREEGYSVQQTADGGFIIAGITDSFGAGYTDVYLVKTDSSGDELWSKTFGGTSLEWGFSVQQTADGGFIITGQTASYASHADLYLIKTDSSGNELWSNTFGGTSTECGFSVQQTADGGFIIAGFTESFGAGSADVYLVKTDSSGNELWSNTFGGNSIDVGTSVQQTADGGFIITGYTNSFGAGLEDIYLIKTDSSGDELWSTTLGGAKRDVGYSVQQTADGGFIIGGSMNWYRPCLIKTDSSGDELWSKTGSQSGNGFSVQQTDDGGFILAGWTLLGNYDVYLLYYNSVKPQRVTLLAPNGGEIIPSGSNYSIEWKASSGVENFKLQYSINNGKDWVTIAKGIVGTTYDWQVPTPTKNKKLCLVKITGYDASGEKVEVDRSDVPFTIEVMNITSPNGGEVLASGGTYDVTWDTNDTKSAVDYVEIYSSTNKGETWKLVATEYGNPGVSSCVFPVVKKNENDCLVKVMAFDYEDKKVAQDNSDAPFNIEVVTITSPNGGETLTSGATHSITWTTNETKAEVTKVKLLYTKNGGDTWIKIDTLTGGDPGTYDWLVPSVNNVKTECRVKVRLKDAQGNTVGKATSDSYFTIEP